MNDNCLWTAWGDVVCRNVPHNQGQTERFQSSPCALDTDCGPTMRCDPNTQTQNLKNPLLPQNNITNPMVSSSACVTCSDVGCTAGKQCVDSSDCAEGLSCQAGTAGSVCTVGSVITGLDNSGGSITSAAGATVAQSLEAKRQAYIARTNLPDSAEGVGSFASAAGATVGQSFEAQRQAYMARTQTPDNGDSVGDCAMFGSCPQGYPCDGSAQCLANLMCDAGVCKTTYSGL